MSRNFKYIPNSVLRQVIFLTVAVLLIIIVVKNLSVFIPGILGAFCMYVLLIHPLRWMEVKMKMNRFLSVLVLMVATIIVIATPILLLIKMLSNKVSQILNNRSNIQESVEKGLHFLQEKFQINLLDKENLSDITQLALKVVRTLLDTSLNGLLQLGVAFLILYFMLMNYKKMGNWFYENIPLKKKNLRILNRDLRNLVISNAVGVPLVAVFQALVAYAGYLIFGLPGSFSWFVLTIFASMIPIVGAALVYVPAVIYMISSGDDVNGYFLFFYCFIIVGSVDNIFRFLAQKVMANMHPLITIFGVVVGINLFGFIGIIFGPILLSSMFWLYKIYKLEFSDSAKEKEEPELPAELNV